MQASVRGTDDNVRSENLFPLDQRLLSRILPRQVEFGARASGGHRSARMMSGIPMAMGISQYMK